MPAGTSTPPRASGALTQMSTTHETPAARQPAEGAAARVETDPATPPQADEGPCSSLTDSRVDPIGNAPRALNEKVFGLKEIDNRERALPIRPSDLNRLLREQEELDEADRAALEELGRRLASTIHAEFFERLNSLKEKYGALDPDSDYVDTAGRVEVESKNGVEEFFEALEGVLDRANYHPLPFKVIREAVAAPNEMGLNYTPNFHMFEHLRIYCRGYTRMSRVRRGIQTAFRKTRVTLDAYQRMVVVLKFKPNEKLGTFARSDVLYLRMFKDVPHVDMEMHLPEQGTKVRMRWLDKLQIASPLFVGVPGIILKVLALSTMSYGLIGGLLLAPITAGVNSFFGFHRAKNKHLSSMIRNLYYLTLANNASVLTRLIDSAEDEEYKEAMLAYYFLWRGASDPHPWTMHRLDGVIEAFLLNQTGVSINFEVADALAKLFRLGLARRDPHGALHATPIDRALDALARRAEDAANTHAARRVEGLP